jgi:transposase InsO family protein
MRGTEEEGNRHEHWARLRFSVVGPLLAAPPAAGDLTQALTALSAKTWRHPLRGVPLQFGVSTIERWYYAALHAKQDPVGALRRDVRKDAGKARAVSEALRTIVRAQYQAHPSWSYQLHYDNLKVLAAEDPSLGRLPTYATVRRYMKAEGLLKQPRVRAHATPGSEAAKRRLERLEVRSFEAEYVHGLWHLDFHHGSRKVLTSQGTWVTPLLLGVLDDHSRLACHLQWYLDETAERLVHGLGQAFQKRALPRALMTDNGSAMTAEETRQGLHTLGILHETTLPYSPYQNAKQEVFWALIEGRLMAMLEGVEDLTLDLLNQATQAWVERDYHRTIHVPARHDSARTLSRGAHGRS